MAVADAPGPLAGVRVLDLTSVVMGPYATQILGDLGADVITIEDITGDTNRYMGAGPHPQLSGTALNLMRNKRNVSLDLKHPDGREACLRLAERSDVMVTNLRPAPLGRLRLTYEDVCERRPDIVFCQAQGWPTDSAEANRPAYDDVVQSASGMAHLYAMQSGEPRIAPTIMADKVAGLTIVYAILAALYHRSVTGEGQRLEVPMVDTMRSFLMVEHASEAVPVPPIGKAGYRRVLSADRRPQRTSDGWVHMLPYSRQNYADLFTAGGRPDLADDPRLRGRATRSANVEWLYAQVKDVLPSRTTSEWLQFCDDHEIPCSPVVDVDDIVATFPVAQHPVAGAYRVIPSPVRFDRTPASLRRHSALIGANGDEVLLEAGYSTEEIAALRAAGALRSVP